MTPLPPRGLPPAKPFPKPITTPPKPDNPPRETNERRARNHRYGAVGNRHGMVTIAGSE